MGNSDDNRYSREFVDGVIRDYFAWKKGNTTDPDAVNANDNQRITGYKVISAANPDDTPASNNQATAGDEGMTAENPASSSEDATRQQPSYRDAIIGNAQNVMPVKEYINASRIEDSGDGLFSNRDTAPGTAAPEQAQNENKPVRRYLTDCEKEKLRPYIPDVDLNNAYIHDGEVPWYLPKDYIGITRGNDIYFRPKEYDASQIEKLGLLGHELTHVGQYRKGMNAIGYLWRCRNYPDCDYEREALATENKIKSELKDGCYPDKIIK